MRIVITSLRPGYVLYQIDMTANTVLLHDIISRFIEFDYLRFHSQGKNRCVPQPIHGFERVLFYKIVMGDMAIIAYCGPCVAAALPRGVF